ncbi:SRPBCC family protein [Amylibacter sp. SFDW26]|uniref:SRPBCC family protein n=1 Tax=Amylibacter sp. SFDW26 TaxID=2652722 RepID=UPI0012623C29|nr:SRPBCC family protein [Amylibacter sp. SFDW26]KAB7613396.1 SRPBCC family protein [Amylibacter sp. SFDW26]
MNFTSKQDIIAPAEHVFLQLADFDFYESYAMRLGAQVERIDNYEHPQPGMCWNISGVLRGKARNVELTLDSYNPVESLSYLCVSNSLDAIVGFTVIPLSKKETRLKASIDIQAKGLSARVALQSARLAKKTLDRKFDGRIHDFAKKIEDKYYV